jgi:hypothetical protein
MGLYHIIYSDTREPFQGNPIPYHKQNANNIYLKHYGSLLFLQFMANSPLSTRDEKHRAAKEMIMAERKMDWATKHPNYNQHTCLLGVQELKKQWKVK